MDYNLVCGKLTKFIRELDQVRLNGAGSKLRKSLSCKQRLFLIERKTISKGRANHFQGVESGSFQDPFPVFRIGGLATFAWLGFRIAMDQWLLCGPLFLLLLNGSVYWVFHPHNCVLGVCGADKLFLQSIVRSPWMMRRHTWEAAWGTAPEEPQPHLELRQIRTSWTYSSMPSLDELLLVWRWVVYLSNKRDVGHWGRGKTVVPCYSNDPQ